MFMLRTFPMFMTGYASSLDASKVKGSYTPKILVGFERRLDKCRMSDPIHNFMCNLLSRESRRLV